MALITAISIDHSAWLGNDREKIGVEKAGIIKANGLAVLADPQLPKSVRRIAEKSLAKIVQVGSDYEIAYAQAKAVVFSSSHPRLGQYHNFKISTAIPHQQENNAGVIAVVAMLNFVLPVSRKQLAKGLKNQHLSARLQLIDREPKILLDVSHNEESVSAMLAFIDGLQINGRIHAIFGALADKRYNTAFTELKKRVDAWYLTTLDGERGQSAQALADKLFSAKEKMTNNYQLFKTPMSAFDLAKRMADKHDIIVIFGSFRVVGAILPSIEF
jgi:dihydrofolate synthase/folylpolyglutamate synthase